MPMAGILSLSAALRAAWHGWHHRAARALPAEKIFAGARRHHLSVPPPGAASSAPAPDFVPPGDEKAVALYNKIWTNLKK
jgi:hypothetical protein